MKDWDWGDYATVDGVVVNGGSGNGSKHVFITAREMARFGLLFLNQGNWNGRQLVSANWVERGDARAGCRDAALGPARKRDRRPRRLWLQLVGQRHQARRQAQISRRARRDVLWASGHNNNRCFVIPEWNMVIVRLGLDGKAKDEVWNGFFEKLGEAVIAPPPAP